VPTSAAAASLVADVNERGGGATAGGLDLGLQIGQPPVI